MSKFNEFKKLSEHLQERVPNVNLEDMKKIIKAYNEYLFSLRSGSPGFPNFCDVCYKTITPSEKMNTGPFDFNFCCNEHKQYINYHDLNSARRNCGITFEDIPEIDFFGL